MNFNITKHQLFHSFCIAPKDRFDGQNNNEEIILKLRAHPITQVFWILNSFFLLLILIVMDIFLVSILNFSQIVFVNVLCLSWISFYLLSNFSHWYYNVGIITNQRIIDIDFFQLLHKEVTAVMLNKVEDVTSKSSGFLSSFFDFGNVFIQTAGTEANVEFMNVPRPAQVAKAINDLINKKK